VGASRTPFRLGIIALLVALVMPIAAPVAAADATLSPLPSTVPSPSASPSPSLTPAVTPTSRPAPGDGGLTPGVFAWEPVGPPHLKPTRRFTDLVAWRDGFALLEERWNRNDSWAAAAWHSPDGQAWTRAALPAEVGEAVGLLPFRGGLVLVTDERADGAGWGVLDYGFWRSDDAVRWERAGGLNYRVPDALARRACQANHRDFASIDGALMVYVALCYDPCCGFGPTPAGAALAMLPAMAGRTQRTGGVIAWRSTDAADWRRQPLRGMDPPGGGGDYGIDLRSAPGELLVLRKAQPWTFLRSSDGIRFTPFGTVPPHLDIYGSLEFIPLDGSVLMLGESFAHEGGTGNTLVGWVMEADGTTTKTLVRNPAFTRNFLSDGSTVVVFGSGWTDRDEDWAWIMGSHDRGRTWDDDLSWIGGDGSCVGQVAAHDGVAVMTACVRGDIVEAGPAARIPAIWVAPFPTPAEAVDGSPAP